MSDTRPLSVLIVEDEYFIADDLSRALKGEGMIVIGPVATEEEARAVAELHSVDCVLLDLNLGGDTAYELARWFQARGTDVTIVTGYDAATLPPSLMGFPIVQKPLTTSSLLTLLSGKYR